MLQERILITGITGSIGHALSQHFLRKGYSIVGYSRDEYKQLQMKEEEEFQSIIFEIGDIRDEMRFEDVVDKYNPDIIVHLAALKQVNTMEYFAMEAATTNILGGRNVARVAWKKDIKKVICISTDKSIEPVSAYGASKQMCDDIFLGYGHSICRLGNCIPSRGCMYFSFKKYVEEKIDIVPVTLDMMTRFWIRPFEVADMVDLMIMDYLPGRVYVPKMPAFVLRDFLAALGITAYEQSGPRPGERSHEVLITENEPCWEREGYYLLNDPYETGRIRLTSQHCEWRLTVDNIKERLKGIENKEIDYGE
jgi:UDP-N-acetylglucosamine 4,6-dehydratase